MEDPASMISMLPVHLRAHVVSFASFAPATTSFFGMVPPRRRGDYSAYRSSGKRVEAALVSAPGVEATWAARAADERRTGAVWDRIDGRIRRASFP
jgi:hypothetical protein